MLAALNNVSGFWMQESDTLSATNTHLLMIFIGIVAFTSLVQAVVVVAIGVGAAKAQKRLLAIVDEVKGKAMPAIASIQTLVTETTPKVKVITENLVETSHVVRAKVQEFDVTLSDVNRRTRDQTARVDGMITSALTAVGGIATTVHHSIQTPMREVVGVVNGLKAGLDVLVGRVKGFGAAAGGTRRRGNDSDLVL